LMFAPASSEVVFCPPSTLTPPSSPTFYPYQTPALPLLLCFYSYPPHLFHTHPPTPLPRCPSSPPLFPPSPSSFPPYLTPSYFRMTHSFSRSLLLLPSAPSLHSYRPFFLYFRTSPPPPPSLPLLSLPHPPTTICPPFFHRPNPLLNTSLSAYYSSQLVPFRPLVGTTCLSHSFSFSPGPMLESLLIKPPSWMLEVNFGASGGLRSPPRECSSCSTVPLLPAETRQGGSDLSLGLKRATSKFPRQDPPSGRFPVKLPRLYLTFGIDPAEFFPPQPRELTLRAVNFFFSF